jgi:hypothetical protein
MPSVDAPASAVVETTGNTADAKQKGAAISRKNRPSVQPPGERPETNLQIRPQLRPARYASLFESLQEKYSTSDILVIMEKEIKEKNYQNVLVLYDVLPKEQARTPQAQIFKLRALQKTDNQGSLAQFLESARVNDGEFFLERAKLSLRDRNYAECKRLLSQCLNLPHTSIDYDLLKQEVYYYTALCATAQFDAAPAEQTYKEALDSWWQLRTALRANPDHEYNKKAIAELQRMAKKMQK